MTDHYEDLPHWLSVSRETYADLQAYAGLVTKWNSAVNLVSKAGMEDLWHRHVLDSAQVFPLMAERAATAGLWCDLGSGGGFPGLVVAILAKHAHPSMKVVLVESDRRKGVFLAEVARNLQLNVSVLSQRIDEVPPLAADILSARGLASLALLCGFADRHLRDGGAAIFPKGAMAAAEIGAAESVWDFKLTSHTSQTDSSAQILVLEDIHRAQ